MARADKVVPLVAPPRAERVQLDEAARRQRTAQMVAQDARSQALRRVIERQRERVEEHHDDVPVGEAQPVQQQLGEVHDVKHRTAVSPVEQLVREYQARERMALEHCHLSNIGRNVAPVHLYERAERASYVLSATVVVARRCRGRGTW